MADRKMLIMDPSDNVAVLLEDAAAGDTGIYKDCLCPVGEAVEFGHKIALTDIEKGCTILKYGHKIGYATKPIRKGEWVHVHNLESERGR